VSGQTDRGAIRFNEESFMTFTVSARTTRRAASAIAMAAGLAAATAGAASAAPTGVYADFAQCPTGNPATVACLTSDTLSGSFKLGNTVVPINKRIRLQGGVAVDPDTSETSFIPAKNGDTLQKTALTVPGGLLGITIPSAVPQPVRGLLEAGINTVNGVKATALLVGPVGFNFQNYLSGTGTAVTLPVRVKLDNPFLGDNCYIGSASQPLNIKLTNGTTTPPAGVAPITGTPGELVLEGDDVTVNNGIELVANTFAAPAANGCGGPLFSWAIDPVVGLKVGLPSPVGNNVARFKGNSKIAPAASVAASDQ
jgi:hypothetical protein